MAQCISLLRSCLGFEYPYTVCDKVHKKNDDVEDGVIVWTQSNPIEENISSCSDNEIIERVKAMFTQLSKMKVNEYNKQELSLYLRQGAQRSARFQQQCLRQISTLNCKSADRAYLKASLDLLIIHNP